MSEKKMVVVDQDVINKIDSNRGILGRVEFVTRCVTAALAEMEPEEAIPAEAGPMLILSAALV